MRAVKFQAFDFDGFGSGGQQDIFGRQGSLLFFARVHLDRSCRRHRCPTVDDLDPVAVEQFAHVLGEVRHDLVLAGQHGGQIQGDLACFDAILGKPLPGQVVVLGSIQHRLAGDAAHVQADPAQAGGLFHHGGLQAELGCTNGRHVSAGSGTDDHQVKLCLLCHPYTSNAMRSGFSTNSLTRLRNVTAPLPSTIRWS